MSETSKYRKFTGQHETEISDSRHRKWRDQFLAAGAERL
jgi:hypothetical protein